MGHKRRSSPRARRAAASSSTTPPSHEQLLANVPADLAAELSTILDESDRARLATLRAGGRPEDADITRVTQMLSSNPRLVEWLNAQERGVRARQQAMQEARDTWAFAGSTSTDGGPLSSQSFLRAAGVPGLAGGADNARSSWGAAGTKSLDHADSLDLLQKTSPTGRITGEGARYNPNRENDKWDFQNAPDQVSGAAMLRAFSEQDEWVRAAINMRRTQVGRSPLACVPINPIKPYSKPLMRQIQRILDQPNEARQNRRELIESVVEDILVLDRGCISKDLDAQRRPHALYAEDASRIRIYPGWSGNPNEPRYLYVDPTDRRKVPLRNDQLICIIDSPGTYRTGLSPVQVLRETIEADRQATRSAIHMVQMKPPPLFVQLPGAQSNQINAIRDYYDTQVAGRKETFFLGGDAPMNVEKLVFSAKDNQWMEWQEYLARKIAVLFKMPPSYFGAAIHANRGSAEINRELYEDTGLVPLMMLIEEYLNAELLGDFAPKVDSWRQDLAALNLKIVFNQVGELQRQMHAEKAANIAAKGLVQLPSFTLNQILAMRGEQPVAGGNTFYVNTSLGPVPWLSYDGNIENYNPLQEMAGMNDGVGNPNDNDMKPGAHPPLDDAVRPGQPQPGGPEQASNDPATPPKKPVSAPTPRDAAKNPVKSAKSYSSVLFDGRLPGQNWSPDALRFAEALAELNDDETEE